MAQLRITKKFAADLKLTRLPEPLTTTQILDDWYIDVIRANRKKVAMITHGESKLTFFLPYADVGGAKSISKCIPVLINEFLTANDFENHTKDVEKIFSPEPVYCKTVNKSVLSHMKNMKLYLESTIGRQLYLYDEINWEDVTEEMHNYLLSYNRKDYYKPIEIMYSILDPDSFKLRKY